MSNKLLPAIIEILASKKSKLSNYKRAVVIRAEWNEFNSQHSKKTNPCKHQLQDNRVKKCIRFVRNT